MMTADTATKTPTITLGRPCLGYVTLHVNDVAIGGISYVNPFVIDDLTDFLEAQMQERDYVTRLDREGLGMAYLVSSETQDLLLVTDDGQSATDVFTSREAVARCAKGLADSIEPNLEEWALWQCPEEDEEQIAKARADVREKLARLRRLADA